MFDQWTGCAWSVSALACEDYLEFGLIFFLAVVGLRCRSVWSQTCGILWDLISEFIGDINCYQYVTCTIEAGLVALPEAWLWSDSYLVAMGTAGRKCLPSGMFRWPPCAPSHTCLWWPDLSMFLWYDGVMEDETDGDTEQAVSHLSLLILTCWARKMVSFTLHITIIKFHAYEDIKDLAYRFPMTALYLISIPVIWMVCLAWVEDTVLENFTTCMYMYREVIR